MTRIARTAALAAGLTLCTLPVLVPSAVADRTSPGTKTQIEYDERNAAAPTHPAKAQVEQREREQLSSSGEQGRVPSTPDGSSDSDAAAWQIALSAALGAAVTGGIVLVSRQANHPWHPVAQ